MPRSALVLALSQLGFTASVTEGEVVLQSKLLELLGDVDGKDWGSVLHSATLRCTADFLKQFMKDESADRQAKAKIEGCTNFKAMWQQLVSEFCPPAPAAPDRRGKKVLG